VRTVDVHARCAFPQAMALLGVPHPAAPNPMLPPVLKVEPDQTPARSAAMDAQGVDIQVLSVNPTGYMRASLGRADHGVGRHAEGIAPRRHETHHGAAHSV
jgi:hypothetical protein